MHLHLFGSSIPEIASLSAKQRQLVEFQCLARFYHGWWFRASFYALTPLSVLGGIFLEPLFHLGLWGTVATILDRKSVV